jgi:hypothetical protein
MILAAMARHTYLTKTGGIEFEQRREVQLVFAGVRLAPTAAHLVAT